MSTGTDDWSHERSQSFTFAHLSDLHATPVHMRGISAMFSKRGLGWIKWRLKRRNQYRPEVLTALLADLQTQAPDHVVITGDLTNFGLEEEFVAATAWLRQIGDRRQVSLVPGNHDVYVPDSAAAFWDHWAEYLESDFLPSPLMAQGGPQVGEGQSLPRTRSGGEGVRRLEHDHTPPLSSSLPRWPREGHRGERGPKGCLLPPFPTLRIRGPIAFVGVSSAQQTGLLSATGTVGARQLERLETVLQSLATASLCRVVLIHHPPTDEGLIARRRLTDAAALRDVLKRVGVELVLHGHTHQTRHTSVPGPDGPIPVVGVRSATAVGHRPERQAQYHLYRLQRQEQEHAGPLFSLTISVREYDVTSGCFQPVGERVL